MRKGLAEIRLALIHFEHVDPALFFLDQVEDDLDRLTPADRGNRRNGLADQAAVGRRFECGNQNIVPALLKVRIGLGCDSLSFCAIGKPG